MQSNMEVISKNEALELVKDSISSIFTKDDVLQLIDRIDAESADISDLKEFILNHVSNNIDTDAIDLDSAEFDLNGNMIELTHVEFDEYQIESAIKDAFDAWDKN